MEAEHDFAWAQEFISTSARMCKYIFFGDPPPTTNDYESEEISTALQQGAPVLLSHESDWEKGRRLQMKASFVKFYA